ncbi:hypothetical protein N7467_007140 [Penicillium canescens]|nr:hypothetical protein N7467_007140 [Penicillium canescens]
MPTYRFELARSGRASCQTKECKDSGDKIPKNEFRVGTWTDTEKIQSWMWRHWGCLTPRMISNMQESLKIDGSDGYNFEQLDGFEDLSEELQDKIRNAVETGHIPDEDWKGDVELNRPGKSGFRVRGKKAEAKNKAPDSGEESPAKKRGHADSDGEEKPAKKKGGPKAKAADTPSATPAAGRKKPGPKPKNTNDDDQSEAEEKPKRGRKPKTTENAEDTDPVAAAEPKKRPPRRKAAPKEFPQPDDEEPKRSRRNRAPENTASKNNGAAEDNDRPKRGRAKKAQSDEAADETEKPKRGRPSKKTQNGNGTADKTEQIDTAEPAAESAADHSN